MPESAENSLSSVPPDAPPRRRRCRLLPDSLFGQLVLTFSLGFLALLTLASLHLAEARQYYMLRGLMFDRARLLTNTALLFDTADADARQRLMDRLSIRGVTLRLASEQPVLPKLDPTLDRGAQKDLVRAGNMFANILNRFLRESREIEPGESSVAKENDRRDSDAPPPWMNEDERENGPVAAVVLETNIPTLLDEILAPLRRLGNSGGKRPATYRATAAVPLSDSGWVIFEDSVPGFRSVSSLPFTGIVMIELFFVLISLVAFYLIVRPLRRLARAADSFGRDMPGTPPLPETGPREVREAAQAFNRMQCRIREFVDERSRTLAAVSHDLRTPLTRMRLRVEQLDDASRLALQKDMDELQQLMDTTIDLARGSDSEGLAPVDVAALLESLVEDRQDMGQNVTLRNAEALRGVRPLLARPLSVKRCLGNLLDNAVRYGGSAEVDVEDNPSELAVIIRDHGPGIPEKELKRVFEPFFRLEPSRSRSTGGNGLGLSIARSMIRMHGGDITLANAPDGGLVARVSFPRRER